MKPKSLTFALTALILLALDQATKAWTRANLRVRVDEIPIFDWFALAHAKNKGAAFSALDSFEYRLWVFYAFTAIAVVVLAQGFRELRDDDRFQAGAMGLILSGALGNFIDRVLFGEVTDMVKNSWPWEPGRTWFIENFGTNVWPIWNVADACILVGVFGFAFGYLFEKDRPEERTATEAGHSPSLE